MNLLKKSFLLLLLLSLTSVAACANTEKKGDQQPTEQAAAANSTHEVALFGFKFSPNTITINVGDTISFQNADPDIRNITIAALNVDQNIQPNQTWSYTFNTAGEFAGYDRLTTGNPTITIVVK